jgi:hypothetical protein
MRCGSMLSVWRLSMGSRLTPAASRRRACGALGADDLHPAAAFSSRLPTALHEMGHMVLEDVADERAAWEWAGQNALVWSLAMERTLQHDRLWHASAGEAGERQE